MPGATVDSPEGPRSLLLCSYEYGQGTGAEGICTERFARALADRDWDISVAASHHANPTLRHSRINVLAYPDRPGTMRVSNFLAQRLRVYLEPGWVWRRRLLRAQPAPNAGFIYGRGMPPAGLLAAASLARRRRKPLALHFSDPFPFPWDAGHPLFQARSAACRRLIQSSTFVTFVTAEALEYTQDQCGLDLSLKAFVLPHVAPEATVLEQSPDGKMILLYAGSFYGRRRPDVLLDGLRLFLPSHASGEFHYVGRDSKWIMELARERGLEDRVKTFPYTENIAAHYAGAQVLIATDANDERPVFLTTKIIEYLNTNRKVLLVSPSRSPGSKLISGFPATALRADESADEVAEALAQLARLQPQPEDFARRFQGMEAFSAGRVGELFENEAARRIPLKAR